MKSPKIEQRKRREERTKKRRLTKIDKLTTQIHQQINDGATNKRRTTHTHTLKYI